jgi:WXG100 family type VII secretion target
MSSPRIRADYDSLAASARAFGQEAASARQTLNNLRRHMEVLQSGDWIGRGATAFYQEMNGALLPSLQRLVTALETAERVTGLVSKLMHAAEEEAATVIRSGSEGLVGIAALGGAVSATSAGDNEDDDLFADVDAALGRQSSSGDDDDIFADVSLNLGAKSGSETGAGGSGSESTPETSPTSPETPAGSSGGGKRPGQGGAGGVGGASLEGGEAGPQRDPLAPLGSDQ